MRMIALILCLVAAARADGGRVTTNCVPNGAHATFHGRGYFFSWEEPKTEQLELSWYEARNFCHARCMDLAGIELQAESAFIYQHIVHGGVSRVWTSGRKCDFEGCGPDFQPANIYGWFWADSLERMPPSTNHEDTDWSPTGGLGESQPDNREALQGGAEEGCMAVLNNLHEDGVRWHDVACHHRLRFVCQEQPAHRDLRSDDLSVPVRDETCKMDLSDKQLRSESASLEASIGAECTS